MSAKTIKLVGNLKTDIAGVKLDGLTVKLKDQNGKVPTSIAETNADKTGSFTFSLNRLMLKRVFQGVTPEVYFILEKDRRELFNTMDEQVISLDKDVIKVPPVTIPKSITASLKPVSTELPKLNINSILKSSGVKASDLDLVNKKLVASSSSTLKELLTNFDKLTTGNTGLKAQQLKTFKSHIQFSAVAGSVTLGKKIVDSGIESLADLGRLPFSLAQNKVGKLNDSDQQSFLRTFQLSLPISNKKEDLIVSHIKENNPDLGWPVTDNTSITTTPRECNCTDCNVFSPYAYLISLIDMLNDHWKLSSNDLEKMVLQDIDSLNCRNGEESFSQIELAVEVLEKRNPKVIKIPLTALQLAKASYQKNFEIIWAKLVTAERDTNKALKKLKLAEQAATNARERDLVSRMRAPVEGIKSIRLIRDVLAAEPKLKIFSENAQYYNDDNTDFLEALEQTYLNAIKLYRDNLIANNGEEVEYLQIELFTDLKVGTCKKTNRISFLILSLQSVVLSGRTGQIKKHINLIIKTTDQLKPLRIKLESLEQIPLEEASWKWLKDYDTWFSAMSVFLYPENAALPFIYDEAANTDEIIPLVHGNFNSLSTALLTAPQDRYSVFQNIIDFYTSVIPPEERTEFNRRIFIHQALLSEPIKLISNLDDNKDFGEIQSVKDFMNAVPHYGVYLYFDFYNDALVNEAIGAPDVVEALSSVIHQLHIPLAAGFVLNKSENYESAHEWYQQLYDPAKPEGERLGFDFDSTFDGNLSFGESWSNGKLDPDAIVHRRKGAMLAHVVLTMVKNLLDWADHEFARGTMSSIDRARQLYELAQVTLDAPDLRDHCGDTIRELTVSVIDRFASNRELITAIEKLNIISDIDILNKAISKIERELRKDTNADFKKIETIVDDAISEFNIKNKASSVSDQIDLQDKSGDELEKETMTDIGIFLVKNPPSTSDQLPTPSNEYFPSNIPISFCVPANPLLVMLDQYIKISLLKFRLCLDISGEPQADTSINYESVAERFDTLTTQFERQPLLNLPANWFNRPPRYRYTYLVEKARQYTDVAQRLGSALLAAYQSKDNEDFQIMNAEHAIEISSSTVDLRNLGLREAQFGLDITELQLAKAEEQFVFWTDRLDNELLSLELEGLQKLQTSADMQLVAALAKGAIALGAAIAGAAASFAVSGTPTGAAIGAVAPGATEALTLAAAASSAQGNVDLTNASFERRREDWELQETLSEFDLRIAEVQRSSAINRIDIADLEMSIAQLQHTNSREVLTFLENKFSSAQLYEWMISVLSQNYRTLMQIASGTAKLAQRALEFERQQHLDIISGDYWSIAEAMATGLNEEQKESGLLGAERLITDLARLDAYKLTSEERRQQVSKSISMAQMLPNELLELKTTGKVTFNTLMHWFDRDFPGQYLRLIKGVRISMLALTPPVDGIHGSLSNSGESTVVVSDQADNFSPIRAFRQFDERITLDSPFNETGLFVFDYNDPMFLPFEGLGVETQWTLELPKAANRFNFDTLVDVIFTIEYTALYSDKYAGDVKELLGNTDSNDIVIQPRLQTPDSWYHFINDPLAANNNRELSLDITKEFLPAHYTDKDSVRTHHVTVVVIGNFSSSQSTKLKKAISIQHDNGATTLTLTSDYSANTTQPEKFNTRSFNSTSNSLFLSTRSDANSSLKLGSANTVNPLGNWKIFVNDVLGSNTSFGELVEDIMVIITTEGDVDWG